jgi:hypothetical protein
VRIRNKDYLIVFMPFFRVHVLKWTPVPPKPKERASASPPTKIPRKLIQMFILKGVLSEAEGRPLDQR